MNMTIEGLYKKLEDKLFQDTSVGTMFYNVYVFQYPADDEYEVCDQIDEFQSRLRRPSNNLDILAINIFDEFCTYLNSKSFGKNPSLLNYLLEKEHKDASSVNNTLIRHASDENFFKWIDTIIREHQNHKNELTKSFVFMYGFGQMFPYLRTNTFLSNFEKYNNGEDFKIIVFYPGHSEGNSFSLFDVLDDANTYRSIILINH